MPLDPNIILSAKPVELPNPLALAGQAASLRDLALRNQMSKVSLEQNQRALQDQKTIADLYRANTDANGVTNHQAVIQGLAQSGLGDKIPAYQQQVAQVQEAQGKAALTGAQTDEANVKTEAAKAQFLSDMVGRLASIPNLTHDQVIAELAKAPPQFAQNAAGFARMLPGDPQQLHNFLISAGLSAQERLKALTPQLEQLNLGGTTQLVDQNPMTRGNAPTTYSRTETPDEARRSKIMEDSMKPNMSGAAVDLAAQRLANGEPASKVLANFGRGKQGAADIAAVQNRFAEVAQERGMQAGDIATRVQELASEGRTRLELGAREGKIAPRVQEALNFAQVAKDASAAVPRGSFMPWNKLSQAADAQLSDPALAKLKAATVSLINAYAASVGGGAIHVHDQETASKLLSSAQSPEAYNAVVDQLILESQKALDSPGQVMDSLRQKTTGQQTAGGATVPADIAALLKKHGG